MKHKNSPYNLTEHLFRNFYQEVFSSLVVKFGNKHINLIEDALQETFYKALKSWKPSQYPQQPKGWLFMVAKNEIINQLKRKAKFQDASIPAIAEEKIEEIKSEDAQLQVLLASSKLSIKNQAKLIFTLKSICGFGVSEIANSLQLKEDNVYKQLQRAKQKLQENTKEYYQQTVALKFTEAEIHYIEQIIYVMFNEGYDSTAKSSKQAINKDICYEAVRLAHLLDKFSELETTKHLLALCYFHISRFDSRINENGGFISLRKQDRTKWDKSLITLGFKYLAKPKQLNRYYIESLIASIHLTADDFKSTGFKQILNLYNILLKINDTPVVRLNRAICMYELQMNDKASKELYALQDKFDDSYIYYSVSMAEYLADKDKELSDFWYKKSLANTKQSFRKEIIKNKMYL